MITPIIIELDELKRHFPGYNPAKAERHQEDSAKLADKWFAAAVKHVPVPVVLLAGGSASGKTEYLSRFVDKFGYLGGIFYDGTLPSVPEIKIRAVSKSKRSLEVHFIIPANLKKSFSVFLNRERQFSDKHFYRTHSCSRKTILKIYQDYPKINIRIIESKFTEVGTTMLFEEKIFKSPRDKIDFINQIQYSEDEIANTVMQ